MVETLTRSGLGPEYRYEVTPLHQAWEGTHNCLWCGLRDEYWGAMQRCPGHHYGDPLPTPP